MTNKFESKKSFAFSNDALTPGCAAKCIIILGLYFINILSSEFDFFKSIFFYLNLFLFFKIIFIFFLIFTS